VISNLPELAVLLNERDRNLARENQRDSHYASLSRVATQQPGIAVESARYGLQKI